METPAHSDLAYNLTQYYFGKDVASIIKILFSYDQISLKLLRSVSNRGTKFENLKKALLILVKHQLVDYVKTVKNYSQHYEYSIMSQRVFHFFTCPRYIYNLRSKEGPIVALALATLFEKGLLSEDRWLQIVLSKLKDSGDSETNIDDLSVVAKKLHHRKFIVEIGRNICVNIERLNRDYRDDLVVEAVNKFYSFDPKIKALCKAILVASFDNTIDEAPITAPVPYQKLARFLVPGDFEDKQLLEKYLTKLTSERNFRFFLACGKHPKDGAMYALNIGAVIDHTLKEHLCSVITTRFGPKCCRVFRLLLLRGRLLLKQIEDCIMLPAKDVREYTYVLIKEGFIRNRQVPKTPDNAAGKSVFIMFVEIDKVVYNLSDLCCRSMSNLLIRHNSELCKNEALLTRSKSVQELLRNENNQSNLDTVANYEVWNQYFNSHELSQLNQINRTLDRMLYAKAQVDETLILTHAWIDLRPNMEKEINVES